jgi:uncharacterized protein YjbI with pentapeptide repeats
MPAPTAKATSKPPVPEGTYEALAASDPAERTALILQLIQSRPHGKLELPARDGRPAVLKEVRLGQASLKDRLLPGAEPPPWWDPETEGVRLTGADLRGADLGLADLRGADLRGADLRGAVLRGADLRGAALEQTRLGGADLAGADLRGAALGEADLQESMLEDAKLQDAALRFANLRGAVLETADLRRADLWGAVLDGAVLTRADLRGATLEEANLQGADLTRVDLQGAVLAQADLRRACLRGVHLQGAVLGNANLERAVLTDTHLQGVDLSRCAIAHVHLNGAWLEKTRLRQEQLGGALGEELAGRYEEARLGYLALERNFVELGDPGAASWAYRRKRRMEKLRARELARAARSRRQWGAAARWYAKYAGDQAVEWLCDYGESISRVLLAMLAVYVLFTLIYGLTDGVVRTIDGPSGPVMVPTRNPVDWVIFSMSAMTTSAKQPVGLLPRNEWIQLLTGVQHILGIALAGLVGFVFGHNARR